MNDQPKKKLRWWQFRLRTMVVFLVLVCIALGLFMRKYLKGARQRDAVASIVEMDGVVGYTKNEKDSNAGSDKPKQPQWLRDLLGRDFFDQVRTIKFSGKSRLDLDKPADLKKIKKNYSKFVDALDNIQNIEQVEIIISLPTGEAAKLVGESQSIRNAKSVEISFGLLLFPVKQNGHLFLKHITSIPNLMEISLGGVYFTDEDAKHLQHLKKVKELDLSNQALLSDVGLKYIENLTQLQNLSLAGTNITDKGLIHLANLKKMSSLSLRRTKITGSGLVNLEGMKGLSTLRLGQTLVSDENLIHLKSLIYIEVLDLSGTNISITEFPREISNDFDYYSDEFVDHFDRLDYLSIYNACVANGNATGAATLKSYIHYQINNFQQLSQRQRKELVSAFDNNQDAHFKVTNITGAGLKYLAELENLRLLTLRDANLTDEAMPYVAKYQELRELNLENTSISDIGAEKLKGLKQLTAIDLSGTKITDHGLEAIAELIDLEILKLENTSIFDQGLKNISKLIQLKKLHLANTQVGDEGLKVISKFLELSDLGLQGTKVTDEGLRHLANLPNLYDLLLKDTNLSDKAFVHLAKFASQPEIDLENTKCTQKGVDLYEKQTGGSAYIE